MLDSTYHEIISFITASGKRLRERSGNIADIGITKQYLTEEDLRIERGLQEIIGRLGDGHSVFAEEEHDNFHATPHVWVIDPISSTKNFIEGLPHYAIVVTHVAQAQSQFAAIYDPSTDELFAAHRGKGAYRNGERLQLPVTGSRQVIFRVSYAWNDLAGAERVRATLPGYELVTNTDSIGVNYAELARGDVCGLICFAKDSFPNFAGSLLVQEAGGIATNAQGESNIQPSDRIFVAGNREQYASLFSALSAYPG